MTDFPQGRGASVRLIGLWILIVLVLLSAKPTDAQNEIIIWPGQNAVQIANGAPAGARILFKPGPHFLDGAINPKNDQTLIGEGQVVLTGAKTLTAWTKTGNLYKVGNQTQQGKRTSNSDWQVCRSDYPRCNYPEALFVDREPWRHMGALNQLTVGCKCWFMNYDTNEIFIAIADPAGHVIQTAVTPQAITSSAIRVRVENLIIEMFASPVQDGAIQANGHYWTFVKVTAQYNSGAGFLFRGYSLLSESDASNNGQIGVKIVGLNGGLARDSKITGLTCHFNNWARVNQTFESGCMKLVRTYNVLVTGVYAVGNLSKGIWLDIDNDAARIEGNYAASNLSNGIYCEIGQGATIMRNTLVDNGLDGGSTDQQYYAGIVVTNCVGVLVTQNVVYVGSSGGGITVRSDGGRAEWPLRDICICGNWVVSTTGRGRLAGVDAYLGGKIENVVFSGNVYAGQIDPSRNSWFTGGAAVNFPAWNGVYYSDSWQQGVEGVPDFSGDGQPTPTPTPTAPAPTITLSPGVTPTAPATVSPTPTPNARGRLNIFFEWWESWDWGE